MNDLELRMYFFVAYNLSPIQQGIQAGHASLEYAHRYGDTELFRNFMKYKTWIILNGGTTRSMDMAQANNIEDGTMNQIKVSLLQNYIPFSYFEEPDLNYALTAVCFLADERVFDKKKYPDYENYIDDNNLISVLLNLEDVYKNWVDFIGGEKNVFLRELLKDKRLA